MSPIAGDDLIGRTIAGGKYQIVRCLGEGGMGAVYKALQPAMNRVVAVKLIRPEMVAKPDAVARFHKEMMVSARIEHPNTIRVYDFGQDHGQLYLAMEFLAGISLRQVIETCGRLELARIVRIGKQVAHALGAIHQHGVVHRDLKPDNVMLVESYGERDFVKVLDFGIAKVLEEQVRLTVTGKPIGTPAFMAPEQAMGNAVDPRTDLYALGVVLYQMSSGRLPFDAPTTGAMLLAHAHDLPTPLLAQAPDTSPALARLIMQLLEKAPAARPANAAEVAARLEGCLQDGPAATLRGTRRRRPGTRPLRSRLWQLVLGGALAASSAGVGYLAVRRHAPERATLADGARHPQAKPVGDRGLTGDAATRRELDELLGATAPLAPEGCRVVDAATVTRLVDASRVLGQDGGGRRALDLLGDNPGPSAEAWVILGRAQLAGNAAAAEASAAEAVRLCPGYAVAHELSGAALRELGQLQLAEDAYARALAAAPSYDAAREDLGRLQLRRNDAAAIATFTELLQRRPDHPSARLARAQAYAGQGKAQEALADLDEAVLLQPGSAEAWAALGELRERLHRGDAQDAYCRAKQLGHAGAAARCKP